MIIFKDEFIEIILQVSNRYHMVSFMGPAREKKAAIQLWKPHKPAAAFSGY